MSVETASGQTELLDLSRAECLELLASTRFGRLAVHSASGMPIIRPVNYVFDERSQSVAFRTAEGSKQHGLAAARKAAFEIDRVAPNSHTGWSVIITGVVEEVTKASERQRLEGLNLETWAPGAKPYWLRIRAWTVSGRRIRRAGAEDRA